MDINGEPQVKKKVGVPPKNTYQPIIFDMDVRGDQTQKKALGPLSIPGLMGISVTSLIKFGHVSKMINYCLATIG